MEPKDAVVGLDSLDAVSRAVVACEACPRLVSWCRTVAHDKRAAFKDEEYWGRPVPGFGDPSARIVVIGLAPAAHGANRTGRMFTGDRSGDFLYAALHRAGLANQPTSTGRDDGLELRDVWITSPVRCAPPANKPTPVERDTCLPFLRRELALLRTARIFIVLGQFSYHAMASAFGVRPRPKFGHGLEVPLDVPPGSPATHLVCSFHVSQQNTFTGRLTEPMFDAILTRAVTLAEG